MSSAPTARTNFKAIMRMEKIARLEIKGLSDQDIADYLDLTLGGVQGIKQDLNYKQVRTRIATGILSSFDEELAKDFNSSYERIQEALPHALSRLIEHIDHPDAKVSMHAIESLLDRDGRLAKVHRMGLPTADQGGAGAISKSSMDIADGLIGTLGALGFGKKESTNGNSDSSKELTEGSGAESSADGSSQALTTSGDDLTTDDLDGGSGSKAGSSTSTSSEQSAEGGYTRPSSTNDTTGTETSFPRTAGGDSSAGDSATASV